MALSHNVEKGSTTYQWYFLVNFQLLSHSLFPFVNIFLFSQHLRRLSHAIGKGLKVVMLIHCTVDILVNQMPSSSIPKHW
jgi:hypothetical protein